MTIAFNIKRNDQFKCKNFIFSQFMNDIILHCQFEDIWKISDFLRKECYVINKELFENICFVRLGFWKSEAVAKGQKNSVSLTPPIHVHIPRSRLVTVNYDIPLIEIFHISVV
jgi:hypothetical protein